jgi:uncharacterized membrane protein
LAPIGWPATPSATAGTGIVTAGIALLLVLPVLRVLLMSIVFARQRDFRFSAIAVLVLAIIVLGAVPGMHTAGTTPG